MESIRLNANESWFNPLQLIQEELSSAIMTMNFQQYPDPDATELKAKLSDYTGIAPPELICTNGSDELIKIIFETFSQAGDTVVIHSPTFIEYKIMSDIRGCKTLAVPPNDDLSPDIDAIINASISNEAAITFICNPNNPTGYIFSQADLQKIINSVPGMVIVDEAYAEFSDISLIGKVYAKDKVVIMRTLSKAFGAAALRVGYGIASEENIKKMNLVKMPYNLSALSQVTASLLLDKRESLEGVVKNIRHERMRVYGCLKALEEDKCPLEVFLSYGNYILIRSDKASDIGKALEDSGYKVRLFEHDENLKNCLRFSITEKKVNSTVVDIIRKVVTE